jgi:hypothetical protein
VWKLFGKHLQVMNLVLPPPLLLLVSFDISGTALPRHVLQAYMIPNDSDYSPRPTILMKMMATGSFGGGLSALQFVHALHLVQKSDGLRRSLLGSTSTRLVLLPFLSDLDN